MNEHEMRPLTLSDFIFEISSEIGQPTMYFGNRASLTPRRILRHGIATIVFWPDGTKTVVKRNEDEPDNEYAAFTAALAIKVFGSNSKVKREIRCKTETQERKKPKREIRRGDKVKYASRCGFSGSEPFGHRWYPEIGTIGEVLCVCSDGDAQVQWPTGATTGDGIWFCPSKCLEVVE